MRLKVIIVGFGLGLAASQAIAADLCKAVALRDVAAIENSTSMIARGSTLDAISQYAVEKHSGIKKFCQHGGYCYPAEITIDGTTAPALKLTNCQIGRKAFEDGDEIEYSVDVLRGKNSEEALRIDDLDNKLLEMGLCSACAGNVATYYVKRPDSQCGRLTRQALEGNPAATAELLKFPAYCQWQWQ